MAIEYDVTTNAGQVRLLIGDTVESGHLFEDAEIAAFLTMNGDNVRLAAAQALETMAANQVMVLKVMNVQGFSTNGAALAAELRNQAKALREQVENGIDDPSALFDIAEFALDPFGRRELILNRALRG